MNTNTLNHLLKMIPLWDLNGGKNFIDLEFSFGNISISGEILSINQAYLLFKELKTRLNSVNIGEQISIVGINREIKKLSTYRIEITHKETNNVFIFSPIEQISIFGSTPKAIILFNPLFLSLLMSDNGYFDYSIEDEKNSRLKWFFDTIEKEYKITSFKKKNIFKYLSLQEEENILNKECTIQKGDDFMLDIENILIVDKETALENKNNLENEVDDNISLDILTFESVQSTYLAIIKQPEKQQIQDSLEELFGVIKKDKKVFDRISKELRAWGYERKNSQKEPKFTIESIDSEFTKNNPLITPFMDYVGEELSKHKIALWVGNDKGAIIKKSKIKSLIYKYGLNSFMKACLNYIAKNPGKGTEGYALNSIEKLLTIKN